MCSKWLNLNFKYLLLPLFWGLWSSFAGHTTTGRKLPWHLSGFAQGSTYHITYYSEDSLVSSRQIDSILMQIDQSMSLYKTGSLINQFNHSSSGITIDEHFKQVVQKSQEISSLTYGDFDITVYPLVSAWGFGVSKHAEIPDAAQIRSILKCVGYQHLKLKGNFLYKDKACVKVDVNGIAQGYSVDVLADFLASRNIQNYIVELGGELRVNGRKMPDNKVMRIGIEGVEDEDFAPLSKVIMLDHGGITTSGNYRQYRKAGNKRISHLIDPNTGMDVDNELISVTVYAPDAITADGYDNALMVMGLKKSLNFLHQQKEIGAYFIYKAADGSIRDTSSAVFPVVQKIKKY